MPTILNKNTVKDLIDLAEVDPPTAYSEPAKELLRKLQQEFGLTMDEETRTLLDDFVRRRR